MPIGPGSQNTLITLHGNHLSGGTRFVTGGANNIASVVAAEDVNKNVAGLIADLKKGRRYPELIGVADECDEIILIEGQHSRATAYAVAGLVEPIRSDCWVFREYEQLGFLFNKNL